METILFEIKENIAYITINRPDKLNALNKQVFIDLETCIEKSRAENVTGIIVTGSGEKAFVAGADIAEFKEYDGNTAINLTKNGQRIFKLLETFPAPTIAAVNGYALGGGCELAMACHLRIASENAVFGQPEVNLGLIPGYGGSQRLIQLIGKSKALEYLLTGSSIKAETALELGLCNYVVSLSELIEKCESILKKTAKKGPIAIQKTIEAVDNYFNKDVEGFDAEAKMFGDLWNTEDYVEGTTAFLEKRKAAFKGK